MKINAILLASVMLGAATASSCASIGSSELNAKSSEIDSVSYALGVNVGESLKRSKVEGLNIALLAAGIDHMMQNNGEKAQLTSEESMALLQTYFAKMQTAALEKNIKAGQEFLEKNKTADGVVTLPSGLQYKIITEGTGIKPKAEDEVEVHYRGTTLSGEEFDSSYSRGEPAKFVLNQVIPGWTEGIQLLKEGSKAIFYIPSDLAYGERGGGPIEPNSTLIFEVELIKVIK